MLKLIDFSKLIKFIDIKKQMGIPDNYSPDYARKVMNIGEVNWNDIRTKGLDIGIEELEICPDGTLEWKGLKEEKILVYIRDQVNYGGYSSGYKYHIAWCSTLASKHQGGTYGKYVVSQRTDGKFLVHIVSDREVIKKEEEQELKVCKNCLHRLNYKGYANEQYSVKNNIYETFSLKEFFSNKNLNSQKNDIHVQPLYNEKTAPVNIYSKDWKKTSGGYRKLKEWRCEECKQNQYDEKHNLHVHHIDGNKSNDRPSNLLSLCSICHERLHPHMNFSKNTIQIR